MVFVLLFTFLGFLAGLGWVLKRQKLTFGKALLLALQDINEAWKGRGGPDLFHEGRWYKEQWYKKR